VGEFWVDGTVPRFGLYSPGGTVDKRKVMMYLDQAAQMWDFAWLNDSESAASIIMRLGKDGTLYADNSIVCGIAQATATLYFANAWNVYLQGRASDGAILTSGNFYSAAMLQANTSVYARMNAATQVFLGDLSDVVGGQPTGTKAAVVFGSAADSYLYRDAAARLRTNGEFYVGTNLVVDAGQTGARIYVGGAGDTTLYRNAANSLKTDGRMDASGGFFINGVAVGSIQKGHQVYNIGAGVRSVQTITFPTAFATAPIVVVTAGSDNDYSGDTNGRTPAVIAYVVGTPTTTSFQVQVGNFTNSGAQNVHVWWMAQ